MIPRRRRVLTRRAASLLARCALRRHMTQLVCNLATFLIRALLEQRAEAKSLNFRASAGSSIKMMPPAAHHMPCVPPNIEHAPPELNHETRTRSAAARRRLPETMVTRAYPTTSSSTPKSESNIRPTTDVFESNRGRTRWCIAVFDVSHARGG